MWPRRLLPLAALSVAAVLATSLPSLSWAQAVGQAGSAAEVLALRLASRDGRSEGLQQGQTVGRDQVLSRAWLAGFSAGLSEGGNSWRVRDAWSEGERAGRAAGYPAGWDLGLAAGGDRAATAYARLDGRPLFRPEPVGSDASSPPTPNRLAGPASESAAGQPDPEKRPRPVRT